MQGLRPAPADSAYSPECDSRQVHYRLVLRVQGRIERPSVHQAAEPRDEALHRPLRPCVARLCSKAGPDCNPGGGGEGPPVDRDVGEEAASRDADVRRGSP
eukprot:13940187-Heterocapsa_arctica.AAC.2